jgi:carbamoylphosphate synthase large subunit
VNPPYITVLFLSGGSQVAQFLLTTLIGRRANLRLIATSSIAEDAGLFSFDAVYLAPKTAKDPAGFERVMEDILAQETVDLIVPARDDDVEFLGSWRDRNPDRAHLAAVGNGEIARITCDKWLSHEYALARDLPFARSMRDSDPDAVQAFIGAVGFPVLAKPRDGFSSQGIYLLDSLA